MCSHDLFFGSLKTDRVNGPLQSIFYDQCSLRHVFSQETLILLKGGGGGGGVDILTTPVFDRPLFSPDLIILNENLDAGR